MLFLSSLVSIHAKTKCVSPENTTITHCRPTHGNVRKIYKTITKHQEDKQSKATSYFSLFPIKMIAKLERTRSNVHQNMDQTQNPTMRATINNKSTTEPPPYNGQTILCFCKEKQYSQNVSINAIDDSAMLQDNAGVSFYILTI